MCSLLLSRDATTRLGRFGLGILCYKMPPRRLDRLLIKMDVDTLTELINEFNWVALIRASCINRNSPKTDGNDSKRNDQRINKSERS